MKKCRTLLCLFLALLFLFETGLAEKKGADRYRNKLDIPLRERDAAVLCDHVWGEWTEVLAVTEVSDGARERVCSLCGRRQKERIPCVTETQAEESNVPADFVPDETWLIWRVTDEAGNVTEQWVHPSQSGLYKTSVVLPDGSYAEAFTTDLYPVSDTVPEGDRVGFAYGKQKVSAYNVYRDGNVYETNINNYIPGGAIIFVLEEMPMHLKVLYGNKVVYIGKKSVYFICQPKDTEPTRIRIQDPVYVKREAHMQYDTLKDGGYSESLVQETVLNLYGYEKTFIITEHNGMAGFVPEKMVNYCAEKPKTGMKVRLYKDRTPCYNQPSKGEISDKLRKTGEFEVEDLFIAKDGTEYYVITIDEKRYCVKPGDVETVPAAEETGSVGEEEESR